MGKLIDLTGQRFGRLTVVERVQEDKPHDIKWRCKCDCGQYTTAITTNLLSGNTQSCGCVRAERLKDMRTTHGQSKTRLYTIWKNMRARCYNLHATSYPRYGGRGVSVCDEWRDDFQPFFEWANSHGYADDLSIDRIDSGGDYCPENCRWSTISEQNCNKRNVQFLSYQGKKQTIPQWAKEVGIDKMALRHRLERGWSIADALSIPPRKSKKTK